MIGGRISRCAAGRRGVMWGAISCSVLLSGLLAASSAAAAVRYATPAGTGPQPCVQSDPCNLVTAATGTGTNGVQNGDSVVVGPGTYPLASELEISKSIDIGGQPGEPLPTLTGSADNLFFLFNGAAAAHDLRIVSSGPDAAFASWGGTSERIYAESTHTGAAESAEACAASYGGAMLDSVCWGAGTGSEGYFDFSGGPQTQTAVIRNVTAVATAPGNVGLGIHDTDGASDTVTAVNVIAHGTLDDVRAITDSSSGSGATLDLQNSNYDTVSVSGTGTSITPPGTNGNQTAAPQLANPGSGDFHELGAPTVGAGVTSAANGTLDLDGNPRTFDGKTDIGAYELRYYTLTVTKAGSGTGTVTSTPSGINCGATCAAPFGQGSSESLTATAAAGSKFVGWTGCTATSASRCSLTLSASQSVAARFKLLAPRITSAKTSSKHHRARLKFKASGSVTGFQCALVRKPKKHHKHAKPVFRSCTSPKTYKHLGRGSYTFEVRALSATGSSAAATKKFKIA